MNIRTLALFLAVALGVMAPAHAQQASCPTMPDKLIGTLHHVRSITGILTATYDTTASVTWVREADELQPLPGTPAREGMIGSPAWREFHEGDGPACPVQSYRIEGGQIQLKFDTKSKGIGGPGECSGTADSTFNADALKNYSALYLGRKGYLLTMVAPDYMMPQSTVKGSCKTPGATTPWESPVNDNAIVVLDRKGEYAGAVTGQMTKPEAMGWTTTATWTFKPK